MSIFRRYMNSPCLYFTRNCSINRLLQFGKVDSTKVDVKGWVNAVRSHKELTFISVNDGSCLESLQVVVPSSTLQHPIAATYGSCVHVRGEVKPSPGKGQSIDLVAESIHVLGSCCSKEYPFKYKKRHTAEYTRQYPHLRPKTNAFASLLRVRNSLTQALHATLQEYGYIQIHTPILTSNDCEGAGEVFQVEPADSSLTERIHGSDTDREGKHFFDVPTFLTVSGQLHLETITGAFSKAYTFGPTFRAENSRTRHHLSEFYMIEAELAFTTHVEDLMQIMENLIQESLSRILNISESDINLYWKYVAPPQHKEIVDNIVNKTYVRMTYTEAVEILEKNNNNFKYKVKWGDDLHKEHEHYLVNYCDDVPVFVTHFPTQLKPFYMRQNDDGKTVSAVDLLLPRVGEVCGGSLREHDLQTLENKLTKLQQEQALQWYLDLRRFGSCSHGGFGLGFERLLQALLGIDNIKDTIPFPRSTHNCKL